jgi:acyl-CoA synthetase (AMP-forming)/AMP-acid ligase II/1-acyl-sn-glycerol-3-phosphate acyltransferase/acyl carrier protein
MKENNEIFNSLEGINVKNICIYLMFCFMRFALWFRYSVTVKGLENINPKTLNKPGGVLFLPNHPTVFVDPTLVTMTIWKKYPVRPMIVEYMYFNPVIHWAMRFLRAIPVPNFFATSNSFKKRQADKVFETVIESLKAGDNFLIYPAGKVKHQAHEVINGSGVHRIVQSVPEANIVLVRTTGLWGSSFSRALTGASPPMFSMIFQGMKAALGNLLFFTPRRKVTIEFIPLPANFNTNMSRIDFNRHLEIWYNRPDGLSSTTEAEPGESLYLVSYSMWKEKIPQIHIAPDKSVDLEKIPEEVRTNVTAKLAEITQISADKIQPSMNLGSDLGLDSLDNAELLSFFDDAYDITGVPVGELTTVGRVMAIAAGQIVFDEQVEEEQSDLSKWHRPSREKRKINIPEGETIPEVFFNQCAENGKGIACADAMSGIVTYAQAKFRILLLAEYIRKLPGEHVGILLPASVTAYLLVIACQLAGKIPLLINWTVGPRHLESVTDLTRVQVVLSAWSFIDKLENIDFKGIEDKIVMLEDVRRELTLSDKIKGFYRSKLGTEKILEIFNLQYVTKKAAAVLLFTSGTENTPKGVPLSHENILANQRAAAETVDLYNTDILLGILPPFHSFGFTVSGIFPLLAGVKVAYFTDPTDGKGLAKAIDRWGATIVCGAPTFLKGIFKNSRTEQLKTLRLCITGAEKAPEELFKMIDRLPNCHLIEGYGITECSPMLTINQEGDANKGVGKPLPGVDLKIINVETHETLLSNQTGLILARGPGIFAGYLNKGLSSPFLFVDGLQWYSTGDLGHLDEGNNLIISGRLKRFVKIGGEMISLAAIEEALKHALGAKAKDLQEGGPPLAICAREEAGEKTRLFLFTVFDCSIEETNRTLREAGFSNLLKVSKVQRVSEIPIMGTGKTNYRALEAHLPPLDNLSEV